MMGALTLTNMPLHDGAPPRRAPFNYLTYALFGVGSARKDWRLHGAAHSPRTLSAYDMGILGEEACPRRKRTCRASRMCSRVCGIGPSVADTTRIAPSICPRQQQRISDGVRGTTLCLRQY